MAEVDPLDAFMLEIDEVVKTQQAVVSKTPVVGDEQFAKRDHLDTEGESGDGYDRATVRTISRPTGWGSPI